MKKLVLIMVCVLLMALFIAFNYLLWDRESKINQLENLENIKANNSANINSLSRDIKNLEEEKSTLQTSISELEDEKQQLTRKNNDLEDEKTRLTQKTAHKVELINVLKGSVNIEVFEAPIIKWAEAVDAAKYEEAYALEYAGNTLQDPPITLQEYSDALKSTIKSLKFKEAKLDTELGKTEGEIYLKVSLEVKAVENADLSNSLFADGLNTLKFGLNYDSIKKEFYISDIQK